MLSPIIVMPKDDKIAALLRDRLTDCGRVLLVQDIEEKMHQDKTDIQSLIQNLSLDSTPKQMGVTAPPKVSQHGARVDRRIVDGKEVVSVIARSRGNVEANARELERAKRHARELGLQHVEFQYAPGEQEAIAAAEAKRARKAARRAR